MNSTNNQIMKMQAQCCIDYCEATFSGSAGPIINTYVCQQPPISAASMWHLHQLKKPASFNQSVSPAGAIAKA